MAKTGDDISKTAQSVGNDIAKEWDGVKGKNVVVNVSERDVDVDGEGLEERGLLHDFFHWLKTDCCSDCQCQGQA